jgi:hypothetical protein
VHISTEGHSTPPLPLAAKFVTLRPSSRNQLDLNPTSMGRCSYFAPVRVRLQGPYHFYNYEFPFHNEVRRYPLYHPIRAGVGPQTDLMSMRDPSPHYSPIPHGPGSHPLTHEKDSFLRDFLSSLSLGGQTDSVTSKTQRARRIAKGYFRSSLSCVTGCAPGA